MEEHPDWRRTGADGGLVAETEGFRLVVPAPKQGGAHAHFLILRKQGRHDLHNLIRSGTEESVHAAMRSAEQIVQWLQMLPSGADGV